MILPYLVEHYGDIASVIGLVVAIIGFAVTITGVRKAKRTAEEALRRIKGQILAEDVTSALRAVRQVDSACRASQWGGAQDQCDEARVSLARLGANRRLEDIEAEALRRALTMLGELITHIQKIRRMTSPKSLPQKFPRHLHDLVATLGGIQERLRSEFLEV